MNDMKESKISVGLLRERLMTFYAKWRTRVESGWKDENSGVRVLRIDSEHIDSEHDKYQYAHMLLAFQYGSNGEKFFVDFRLSVTEPQAKIVFYPQSLTGWGEDRSPLVVSYSEIHGRSITLRPYEFDAPLVGNKDIDCVEKLLNEVTTDLGLFPEVPFDFVPVRKYIERYQEVFEKTQFLWAGLYDDRCAIDAAWDGNFVE